MEKACIYYKGRTVAGAESSVIKFRYTALLILSDILCTLSSCTDPRRTHGKSQRIQLLADGI